MKSTFKLQRRGPDDVRVMWDRFHTVLRTRIRGLSRLIMALTIALMLMHIFFPSSLDWINKVASLPEPSLAAVLCLLVTIMIFERVFAIEDEFLENPDFLFGPQEDLYRRIVDELVDGHISPRRVIFVQHSGQTASTEICKLLRNTHDTEIVLYQQSPECATVGACVGVASRIKSANEHFTWMDGSFAYRSRLQIRRFLSTASMRAMIVDDRIIVVSWYQYFNTGADLQITGSENTGLYITSAAADFAVIRDMIFKSIEIYDQESNGQEEQLSPHVTLHHCKKKPMWSAPFFGHGAGHVRFHPALPRIPTGY